MQIGHTSKHNYSIINKVISESYQHIIPSTYKLYQNLIHATFVPNNKLIKVASYFYYFFLHYKYKKNKLMKKIYKIFSIHIGYNLNRTLRNKL